MLFLLHRAWDAAESVIGALYAACVGLMVGLALAGLCWMHLATRWSLRDYILGALGLSLFTAEILFLRWLSRLMHERAHPLGLSLALRQPRWPRPLSPVVAAWWAAHFLAATAMAVFVEHAYPVAAFTGADRILFLSIYAVLVLAGAYASNLYLLLAVGAIASSPGRLAAVWRWRFLLDLGTAAIAAAYFAWR